MSALETAHAHEHAAFVEFSEARRRWPGESIVVVLVKGAEPVAVPARALASMLSTLRLRIDRKTMRRATRTKAGPASYWILIFEGSEATLISARFEVLAVQRQSNGEIN